MSYSNYDLSENDPYCIEGSTCLINSLGITDTATLNKAEEEISAIAMIELDADPVTQTFDLSHLQEIHSKLFSDIYPWAGEIRRTEISKGGKLFLPYQLITEAAERTFHELSNENYLKGLKLADFAARAGYYLGVINCIHPFREGNGRTQRIFFNQLAFNAGYGIEWSAISGNAMAEACRAGRADKPDYSKLIKLLQLHTVEIDTGL